MDKLIITVAPVGAEVTREQNPNLPLTPEEIAEDVFNCWKEGASIAHVHGRDKNGVATQDAEVYRQIIEEIKKRCDIIVQVSTGGAVGMSREVRIAPVSLKPEMATLSTGTCNFGRDVFMNTQDDMEFFATEMKKNGVLPEIEVFDAGMIPNALQLIKKEFVPAKVNFDFVLGVPGAMLGSAKNLVFLSGEIPKNCTWTVAGIGRYELPLAVMAISMGGNVRVGFEDNIFYSKGVVADSNAQLVARISRVAKEVGREVATPDEARKILGIEK
jgi:3-keto-5-aminohexanoate cleavage enzyme